MIEGLDEKLARLSTGPGVYLMRDEDGEVIYVGKARSLRKRVSTYFRKPSHKDMKTGVLVSRIASFDTILTGTEKEALILESNLIKKHRPRYNVILKDGKRYPSLRIDMRKPYPRLEVVRKVKKDGAMYFGPYAAAGAAKQTSKFLHKNFKLRKCKGADPPKRARPCLFHQMNQCLAPCCLDVSEKRYHAIVEEIAMFLKGRTPQLVRKVLQEMLVASQNEQYELAAELRDRMFALNKTVEKQVAVTTDFMDRDVIALAREPEGSMATILFVRGGKIVGSRHYPFLESLGSDVDILENFVRQYYDQDNFIPREILVPLELENRDIIEQWLGEARGRRVHILAPQRGEKARLVEMAVQNARDAIREHFVAETGFHKLLGRLQRKLGMERFPERIECFDISNLMGTNPVASMVVFEDGAPARDSYRRFKIRDLDQPDDYAAMAQVLSRRFADKEGREALPDLLMVDGGRGQLSVATAVLKELDLDGLFSVVGIAKANEAKKETGDKVYRPGQANPVMFGRDTDLLLFLQRVRDEAHRFAVTFHRKRRGKAVRKSVLDEIPGVGEKRKKALLRHFGSLKALRAASIEEIADVPGIPRKLAETLFAQLGGEAPGAGGGGIDGVG
ncbi:MAG: excinuclease ABC subunit UvrC [Desulfatibacillaceae bacterium]